MKQINIHTSLEKVLKRVVERIVHYDDPERIILFGSLSKGVERDDSDIDLLVIKETNQPIEYRAVAWRADLHDIPIPFDIMIMTPDEYEHGRKKKYSFVYCIMKNSKVLYEKT